VKQLTRDQRRSSILDVAGDLVDQEGDDAITMSEIAIRVGISRQSIYTHFRSSDQILEAFYRQTIRQYFFELGSITPVTTSLRGSGFALLSRALVVPARLHRVVYSAFFAGPNGKTALASTQQRLYELIESEWIEPVSAKGVDRAVARCAVYATFSSMLQFRELMDRGLISFDDASLQLWRLTKTMFANPEPDESRRRSIA
jgi:AcrR family transcriptional regulator